MSVQLRAIAIYSHDGERRDVRFDLGKLNIVTGAAATGKSTLLDIVDYCWGRDECTIAKGEIRRAVGWFAILLDKDGEGIFIARRNPGTTAQSSDEIFFHRHVDELPETSTAFRKNITGAGLRMELSRILGIDENQQPIDPVTSRRVTSASSSQAIFFCLQLQDEIASRRLLFHRQGEEFIPGAIKDTLPYFLGAMEEDYYLKQRRFDETRLRLRKAERDFNEVRDLARGAATTAADLLRDAKRAQLVPEDAFPSTANEARELLAAAAAPRPRDYTPVDDASSGLAALETRRRELRAELIGIREDLDELIRLDREAHDFEHEAREQNARLASIGLLSSSAGDSHLCPLCESHLDVPVPSVDEIRNLLGGIDQQLSSVQRDSPRLQKLIADLEDRRAGIDEQLKAVQRDIQSRIADNERLRIEQDVFTEQARIAGRISYYLENVKAVGDNSGIKLEVARLGAELKELEKSLDPEALAERIATALSLVGRQLTRYAQSLGLEHGDSPLRLDRRHLTVVADTINGPYTLMHIGSGENWVGYHVAAHLALHELFRRKSRPVPAFLMLDQPSQAHYPPERDLESVDAAFDEDRTAVARLFRLLDGYCDELAGMMQVIVTDHVEFLEPWFQDRTVERWRDGIKLVPAAWLKS